MFFAVSDTGSFRTVFLATTLASCTVLRGGGDDRSRAVIAGLSRAMGPSDGCVANRAVGVSLNRPTTRVDSGTIAVGCALLVLGNDCWKLVPVRETDGLGRGLVIGLPYGLP